MNLALVLLFVLAGGFCADGAPPAPPSSASSLISSRRVVERAGEAVWSGKEDARDVSLKSSALDISRMVS